MKTTKMLLTMLLLATTSVVFANEYDFTMTDETAQEVVIGEGAVPAPSVESYGVMPSWANGCCDRVPSKADHLWDNYCYEKGCGPNFHLPCPCQKNFCGIGPFQKQCCCKGKGAKCGRKIQLPKLNIWNKCCQKTACVKSAVKSCTQKVHRPCVKTKCCQKPVCQKPVCQKSCVKETKCKTVGCRKPLLSKLRLFRGCHGSKCGKGKGKGGMVVPTTVNYGDAVPTPAMDGTVIEPEVIEMPNEVPTPPGVLDPAA